MEDQIKSLAEGSQTTAEEYPTLGVDASPILVTSENDEEEQEENGDPSSGAVVSRMPLEAMVPKFDKLTAKAHEAEAFLHSFKAFFDIANIPHV